MKRIERLALRALEFADAETARDAVIRLLRLGLVPCPEPVLSPRLSVRIADLEMPNPLGLAAGFDKDAVALAALAGMGFGFIEAGAVTPDPQPGNSRPRLFRLQPDQAVINRFGFNSQGAGAVAPRLAARPRGAVIGINAGANNDSEDRTADYASVIESCGRHADFVTVNVSSPNTGGLRRLQRRAELQELLSAAKAARNGLPNRPKLFLKLAPDLPAAELRAAAETAAEAELDAIIATNTMAVNSGKGTARGQDLGLISTGRGAAGGLSGQPLFALSTRALGEIYHVTEGSVPLIGVGGIATADDAFTKILAGASALQLYTSLVFHGFSQVPEILRGLDHRLNSEGMGSVAEAVGAENARWRLGS